MPQAQTYQSEFTGQEMDARFAAVAQLTAALEALTTVVAQKYVKPASGIPSTDMDADVQAALAKANTAVQSLADYYTKSEVDQLLAAINGMDYVDVATLPTASADTLGKIYLVGPDGSGYYAYYYTSYDGSAYSWVGPLGTTQISLANYATKAELSQLDQEIGEKEIHYNRVDFPTTAWKDNIYIHYNNGNEYSSSQGLSGLRKVDISVCAGKTLHYKKAQLTTSSGNAGIAFYDSSSTFISGSGVQSEYNAAEVGLVDATVQVPADAKYASFTCPTSLKSSFEVWYNEESIEYLSGIGKRVQDAENDIAALQLPKDIAVGVDSSIENFSVELAVASHRYNVQYKILPGSIQAIKMKTGYQVAIRYLDVEGSVILDMGFSDAGILVAKHPDAGGVICDILFQKEDGTALVSGGYSTKKEAINDNMATCAIEYYDTVQRPQTTAEAWQEMLDSRRTNSRSIRSIAHQGFYGQSGGYGYNMAEYYIKAALYGFDWAECDIKFSSDGVPVCCHDATFVDGTTMQTITIASETWEQLQAHDYHGGKISSFDEVMRACKVAGIGLNIDHLSDANTSEKWAALFAIVKKYAMDRKVTWLVNSGSTLPATILEWDKFASICILDTSIDAGLVAEANALKTDYNEIRLGLDYRTSEVADILSQVGGLKPGILIDVWTVDSFLVFQEYLPYVAGITSNRWSEPMVAKL